MQELHLLSDAAQEIKMLRHQNALMNARLQMFDDVMLLFKTEPSFPRQGMSPDIVAAIEKHLEAEKQLSTH